MAKATRCQICRHAEQAKIEALVTGGWHQRTVAAKFDVGVSTLSRHMSGHVSAEKKSSYLLGSSKVQELRLLAAEENGSVLEDLGLARSMTFNLMAIYSEREDGFKFASLVSKFLDIIDAIGRRTGEVARLNPAIYIDQSTTNNVAIFSSPEFIALQSGMLQICRDHPAARSDIVNLLRRLGHEPRHQAAPMLEAEAAVA